MTVAQCCSYIRITAFAGADSLIVIDAPLGLHFIIVVSILVFIGVMHLFTPKNAMVANVIHSKR